MNIRQLLNSVGIHVDRDTFNLTHQKALFIKGRKVLGEKQPAIESVDENAGAKDVIRAVNQIIAALEAHGLTSDDINDPLITRNSEATAMAENEKEGQPKHRPLTPSDFGRPGTVGTSGVSHVGQPDPRTGDSPAQPDLEGINPGSGRHEGVTNTAGSASEPMPPRMPEEESKEISSQLSEEENKQAEDAAPSEEEQAEKAEENQKAAAKDNLAEMQQEEKEVTESKSRRKK